MRKVLFILMSVTFLVGGAAFAEDAVSAAEPAPAQTCDVATEAAAMIAAPQAKLEDMMTFEPSPTPASGPPPCPTSSTCAGGSNRCNSSTTPCQANGSTTVFDTGERSCTLPGGQVGKCLFGTIHIYTTQCGQCPCCSSQPACLCPINCGQAKTWGCA